MLRVVCVGLFFLVVGCSQEPEPSESTPQTQEGKGDRPLKCIDCGEGATCELVAFEDRTRLVCQADAADPLTCAESYQCEHDCWDDFGTCTEACDDTRDVPECQAQCFDKRAVCEAFCRDRDVAFEPVYVAYDDCRFENCSEFWSEFDGLAFEIDCMQEHCAERTADCLAN